MNEAKALRVLADRLDELESLKAFPAEIGDPGTVTVEWTEGKDHDGYGSLSQAISALVGQHWNALRSQVLKSKESEVQSARNTWTGLSAGASTSTASTGTGTGTGTGAATSTSPTVETTPPTTPTGPDGGVRRFG